LFERFTNRARRVLVLAQEEARLLNHGFIGTEHILLGLIHEEQGGPQRRSSPFGISLEAVREQVEEMIGPAGSTPTVVSTTRRSSPLLNDCQFAAVHLCESWG
jgi:ATP-dependent Clp protease ATP-binding subunit ClpC